MSRRLLASGEQKVTMTGSTGRGAKSARTRVNPRENAGTGRKNPTSELVGFSILVELGGFEPAANSSPKRVLADPCEIRVNGSVLLADGTRTPVQSRTPRNEPDVDSRLAVKLAALAQR